MVAVLVTAISLLACITTGVYAVPPPPLVDFPIGVQNQTEREVNKRVSFVYKYVTKEGKVYDSKPAGSSIAVCRTNSVPELAQEKACEIVGLMIRNMPKSVFSNVARSLGVGLFTKSEGLVVYPENSRRADTPECRGKCTGACKETCTFDGRKWSSMAGMTTNRRAVSLDDNVLCNKDDPYKKNSNIVAHEFAHLINKSLRSEWRRKITMAYRSASARGTWRPRTYAMANEMEYWAVASESFFLVNTLLQPCAGMNMCGTPRLCKNEMQSRDYIKIHDPLIFEVLSYVYTDKKPTIPGGLKVCQ